MRTHESREEEKTAPKPNVNFVWFGKFREDSFKGPQLLSQAGYPVTYWVDADQVDAAKEELKKLGCTDKQVTVKSIQEVIRTYCAGNTTKIDEINALLKKCREEDLPTVQKEILAPIIESQTSGYFFDTNIGISAGVNLPMLDRPALVRNLMCIDDEGDLLKYKPLSEALRLTAQSGISSVDLYAYFSDASQISQALFTQLADDTISTWQEFFTKKMEYKPLEKDSSDSSRGLWKFVNSKLHEMIQDTLMGPAIRIYQPQIANDKKSIVFLFDKKSNTLQMGPDTGVIFPDTTQVKLKFTTIDGVLEREDKGEKRAVELFCEGSPLCLTKYITATWTQKFERYVRRNIVRTALDAAIEELRRDNALQPPTCTAQEEPSIIYKVLGKVFERLPHFKSEVRHSGGFYQVSNNLTESALLREELQKKLQAEYPGHFNNIVLDTEQPNSKPKPPSCSLL
jgi:hypothetical protein